MLVVHKIIDALLNKGKREHQLMEIPGVTSGDKLRVAALLEAATKFDFGPLHLEGKPDADGTWNLPTLTLEEMDIWKDGFIPLPYDICWYEFELGGTRTGLLIVDGNDTTWNISRLDLVGGQVVFDNCWMQIDRMKDIGHTTLGGNPKFIQIMTPNESFMQSHFAPCGVLAIFLSLMVGSKTTEVSRETAPPKLNKKRAAQGKTLLYDHRVVTIVPNRFRYTKDAAGGTHRSPRLHWRRTHIRHFKDENGVVIKKTIIPRMLVGRAENGSVSHEYRIDPPKNKS